MPYVSLRKEEAVKKVAQIILDDQNRKYPRKLNLKKPADVEAMALDIVNLIYGDEG